MQITINLKIFLFLLMFSLTGQIKIYGILMFFALLHELGHLIAGILLGLNPKKITIMPLGLKIIFEDYKTIKKANLKRTIIAFAGPVTNLIIIVATLIVGYKNSEIILYSNILIGLFNLLPIYPLDGGRIINGILNIILGMKKSLDISNKISNITIILLTTISSILILYMKNITILIILAYLWYLVIMQNIEYKTKKKIQKIYEDNQKLLSSSI